MFGGELSTLSATIIATLGVHSPYTGHGLMGTCSKLHGYGLADDGVHRLCAAHTPLREADHFNVCTMSLMWASQFVPCFAITKRRSR